MFSRNDKIDLGFLKNPQTNFRVFYYEMHEETLRHFTNLEHTTMVILVGLMAL